ncbi:MAG: enoyl-CoA hydratase/isomerase family protein [Rhodocyclaceae bacterium]
MPDILSTRDGGIATVTLSNPGKLNALNATMWQRLVEVFATLDADDTLRCVIVRGAGTVFAAGGDLDEMQLLRASVAGATAKFGALINRLGFSMYPGELAGLLRQAGPAVVKEILLEGRLLSAQEAYEKGLLTRVVADAISMPR